jgi:hypothetical protein
MCALDAAELLYLNVLSGKFETLGTSSSRDELGDLLTEVSWESDNVESISEGKRKAFSLIGLDYTAPTKATNKSATKKAAVDELDSYETLVKEAGMNRFCVSSQSRRNESALYTILQAIRSVPRVMKRKEKDGTARADTYFCDATHCLRNLYRAKHCCFVFPSTFDAMFVHRSFFSTEEGNSSNAASNFSC